MSGQAMPSSELEIRALVQGLRRRWWLIVGLPAAVLLLHLALVQPPPLSYQVPFAFAIDIPRSAIVEGSDEGTAAGIGEALVDDIARIVSRDVFAEAVAARLPGDARVAPGEIAAQLSATDKHRIVEMTVTRQLAADPSPAELVASSEALIAIALATVAELEENGQAWFARLGEDEVQLSLIDRPEPPTAPLPPSLRQRLDLPLRLGLAFLLGLGLAAWLQMIDPRLRVAREAAQACSAPVLAQIPRWR